MLLVVDFHFSCVSRSYGGGLVKGWLLSPTPIVSDLVGPCGAQEYAFLTSAQVVGASATNLRTTLTIILSPKCVFELM